MLKTSNGILWSRFVDSIYRFTILNTFGPLLIYQDDGRSEKIYKLIKSSVFQFLTKINEHKFLSHN